MLLTGCGQEISSQGGANPQEDNRVKLWVTTDFGVDEVFTAPVPFRPGEAVLDLLIQHLEVETHYGGGFVNSINGIRSGYTGISGTARRKSDWFYWVNGILSSVGAGDYFPQKGDVIWWDYHNWETGNLIPAVVGAYPQPFINGYSGKNPGVRIMFTPEQKELAAKIGEALNELGAPSVEVVSYQDSLARSRDRITMVVGLWSELEQYKTLADLARKRNKVGLFVDLQAMKFTILDAEGLPKGTYGAGTGAILATGAGPGDPYPLWVVTAVDVGGLEEAVEILTGAPERLERHIGVLVRENLIIGLPAR